MPRKILIKGAGEHASGTAHRLFRCGFAVVMTEVERPTTVRRRVAFASAIYAGAIEVEGVRAVRARPEDVGDSRAAAIPVLVDPDCRIRESWRPDVLIDARILKYNLDNRLTDAPLVIGFGPGLVAGRDVHFVVETNRGHDLGRIIVQGTAAEDTAVPGDIAGHSVTRVLRAPGAGIFRAECEIGDRVRAGDRLGTVGGLVVAAAIDGVVRGLLYPGLDVAAGQKLGDIDPRGEPAYAYTLSDKTRALSGAALEIIVSSGERG